MTLRRPKRVKCDLCSGSIDIPAVGRIRMRHPLCKLIEAALVRLQKLLDDYKPPTSLEGRQSMTWIRSRLWRMANSLNDRGVPARIRPKDHRRKRVAPIRIRKGRRLTVQAEAA